MTTTRELLEVVRKIRQTGYLVVEKVQDGFEDTYNLVEYQQTYKGAVDCIKEIEQKVYADPEFLDIISVETGRLVNWVL